MTIIEMHSLCDLLIDKADAPWFNSEEKDKFINLAQIEFLDSSYRFFEYNEEIREKLLPLVKSFSYGTGSVSQLDLSAITDFRYVLSLRGDHTNSCGGVTTRQIPPVQLDDEVGNQLDPFNINDDRNPGYTQENNGVSNVINIISTTSPTNVIIKYLKTPVDVKNDIATPANNVNCEISSSAHEEIVNIAVRKMLGNIQDQFGYQVQSQESKIQ
tara:strand:- start:534 stop:1175 length:642 start_codon:yes stop_codon:yes gene_type:complete